MHARCSIDELFRKIVNDDLGQVIQGQTRSNVKFSQNMPLIQTLMAPVASKDTNDDKVVFIHSHNMSKNVLNAKGHHRSRQVRGQIRLNLVKFQVSVIWSNPRVGQLQSDCFDALQLLRKTQHSVDFN